MSDHIDDLFMPYGSNLGGRSRGGEFGAVTVCHYQVKRAGSLTNTSSHPY